MKNKTNICLAVVLILFVIGGIFLYAQSETFTINSTSSNVLKYEAKRNQENPKDSMQTFSKDDSKPPIILVNKAENNNWAKLHAVTITISDKYSNLAEEI